MSSISSANRPKRRRKEVCHYSDDNPNTFTVKVKKGENEHEVIDKSSGDSTSASCRPGIKRGRRSKHAINHHRSTHQEEKDESDDGDRNNGSTTSLTSTAASAPSPATPPPPRPRGRPPRRTSVNTNASSSSSSSRSSSPRATISSTAPRTKMTKKVAAQKKLPVAVVASTARRGRKRIRILASSTLPAKPQDTILSHTASIQTVLPLDQLHLQYRHQRRETYEEFIGVPPPPAEWVHLDSIEDSIQRKSPSTTNQQSRPKGINTTAPPTSLTLPPNSFEATMTTTVARAISITAFSSRQLPLRLRQQQYSKAQDEDYDNNSNSSKWIVTGSCVGGVSLWKVGCPRPICRLDTQAGRRERQRVVLSKKVISYPNSVQQTAWSCSDIVLVLTETDLEGIRIITPYCQDQEEEEASIQKCERIQQRLFLVNVTESLFLRNHPPSQRFHFHYSQQCPLVLWSTDERDIIFEQHINNGNSNRNNVPPSLLCLKLQTAGTMDSIQSTAISVDGLDNFRCMVAVWDASSSACDETNVNTSNVILAVAQTSNETLELLRLRHHENVVTSTYSVSDRYALQLGPGRCLNKTQMDYCLQQIPMENYKYTILSGTRIAIQLIDSRSLTCLATFGKSVSLHGKSVHWKSCLWVQMPSSRRNKPSSFGVLREGSGGKFKQVQLWLERSDEVAARMMMNSNHMHSVKSISDPNARYDDGSSSAIETGVSTSGESCMIDQYSEKELWLIGVPHPDKGPSELKSTLYIWKNPLLGLPDNKEGEILDPIVQHQQLLLQQQADSGSLKLPPGGCLGLSIVSHEHDLSLLCATSETGQLYEKKSSLQTDFPGTMYPVCYKVIDDNIEYIEDEDEMDQPIIVEEVKEEEVVMTGVTGAVATTAAPVPKPRGRPKKNPLPPPPPPPPPRAAFDTFTEADLTEALRLSLIEMNQNSIEVAREMTNEEEKATEDEEVDVLDESRVDNAEYIVPCWPSRFILEQKEIFEQEINKEDRTDITADEVISSPTSNSRKLFESKFLRSFPQYLMVNDYCQQLRISRIDFHHQDSGNCSVIATSSIAGSDVQSVCSTGAGSFNGDNNNNGNKLLKSKRTRIATVETVLQSSVDRDLRSYMSTQRGKWVNGSGSSVREQHLLRRVAEDEEAQHCPRVSESENKVSSSPVGAASETALTSLLIARQESGQDATNVVQFSGRARTDSVHCSNDQATTHSTKNDADIAVDPETETVPSLNSSSSACNELEQDSPKRNEGNKKAYADETRVKNQEAFGDPTKTTPGILAFNGGKMFVVNVGVVSLPESRVIPATQANSKLELTLACCEAPQQIFPDANSGVDGHGLSDALAVSEEEKHVKDDIGTGSHDLAETGRKRPVDEFKDSTITVAPLNGSHNVIANKMPCTSSPDSIGVENPSCLAFEHSSNIEPDHFSSVRKGIVKSDSCAGSCSDYSCGKVACLLQKSVVTASERIPALYIDQESNSTGKRIDKPNESKRKTIQKLGCAACRGRLVVHSCGTREKPVDYEAIARAERERTERLAAEKAQAKAEKRRLADAKRREAKLMKKREEEERKKREEEAEEEIRRRQEEERREMEEHERRLRLEEEKRIRDEEERQRQLEISHRMDQLTRLRFEQNQDSIENANGFTARDKGNWEVEVEPGGTTIPSNSRYEKSAYVDTSSQRGQEVTVYTNKVPSYRTINQMSDNARVDETTDSRTANVDGWYHRELDNREHSYPTESFDFSSRTSLTIGGTTVQPSTSLHPADALVALAGLADSMRVASSDTDHCNANKGISHPGDVTETSKSYVTEEYSMYCPITTSVFPYEYSGSLERQAAIHRALADSGLAGSSVEYDPRYDVAGCETSTQYLVQSQVSSSEQEGIQGALSPNQHSQCSNTDATALNDHHTGVRTTDSNDEAEYDAIVSASSGTYNNCGEHYAPGWQQEVQSQNTARSTSSVRPLRAWEQQ